MNTILYNNFEFTYENHFTDQINKTELVIVYDNVTIVKGDGKFLVGEHIDQILILNSIHFENKDGSEYVHNNYSNKDSSNTQLEIVPSSGGTNWNAAVNKIYNDFETLKNSNNCNKIQKSHSLVVKLDNILKYHIKYVSFLLSKTIRPKLEEIKNFTIESSLFNNKPNLLELYKNTGDIRMLDDCLHKYVYNITEINQVINMYEELENIPEVEHIMLILKKYPYCYFSEKTMEAIQKDWPETFEYIKNQKKLSRDKLTDKKAIFYSEKFQGGFNIIDIDTKMYHEYIEDGISYCITSLPTNLFLFFGVEGVTVNPIKDYEAFKNECTEYYGDKYTKSKRRKDNCIEVFSEDDDYIRFEYYENLNNIMVLK